MREGTSVKDIRWRKTSFSRYHHRRHHHSRNLKHLHKHFPCKSFSQHFLGSSHPQPFPWRQTFDNPQPGRQTDRRASRFRNKKTLLEVKWLLNAHNLDGDCTVIIFL
jgi:hypothetical protein